jgi:hypothetical protein
MCKVLETLQVYLKFRRAHDGTSYSCRLIDNSKFWEQETEIYRLRVSFDAINITFSVSARTNAE